MRADFFLTNEAEFWTYMVLFSVFLDINETDPEKSENDAETKH